VSSSLRLNRENVADIVGEGEATKTDLSTTPILEEFRKRVSKVAAHRWSQRNNECRGGL